MHCSIPPEGHFRKRVWPTIGAAPRAYAAPRKSVPQKGVPPHYAYPPPPPAPSQVLATLTGLAGLLGGMGLSGWSLYELASSKNLHALPEPRPDATLVTNGPFECVRPHPPPPAINVVARACMPCMGRFYPP